MATRQARRTSERPDCDKNDRKRVCKACNRCRLKKSKCNGSSSCSRCRADNAICVFGGMKRTYNKVYPKGYVESLEKQQSWLVGGLQALYRRSVESGCWFAEPLEQAQRSSTHSRLAHEPWHSRSSQG